MISDSRIADRGSRIADCGLRIADAQNTDFAFPSLE
jgi:hypothetical protein